MNFPRDESHRNEWILAIPIIKNSLIDKKDIYECESHFIGNLRNTDFKGTVTVILKRSSDFCICDNYCLLNQSAYNKLGGPGKVVLPSDDKIFLIYDYVHIVKNVRNNWITEATQKLAFEQDGKHYIAD